MEHESVKPARRWMWPAMVAVLILAASHRPTLAGTGIEYGDKVVHFAVYGLMATLMCRLGRGWKAAWWACVAAAAFGATDEWHQSFVPGRTMELADWIADVMGAALAVALYAGWPRYRDWLESPVFRRRNRARRG